MKHDTYCQYSTAGVTGWGEEELQFEFFKLQAGSVIEKIYEIIYYIIICV